MNPKPFNVDRMISESEEADQSRTTDRAKCLFEDRIVHRYGVMYHTDLRRNAAEGTYDSRFLIIAEIALHDLAVQMDDRDRSLSEGRSIRCGEPKHILDHGVKVLLQHTVVVERDKCQLVLMEGLSGTSRTHHVPHILQPLVIRRTSYQPIELATGRFPFKNGVGNSGLAKYFLF